MFNFKNVAVQFALIVAIVISSAVLSYSQNPTLVFPENNTNCVEKNVTFKWNYLATATAYVLKVSELSDFSALVVEENVPDTNIYFVNNLNYNKKYYWKVIAYTPLGEKESNVSNFTTHPTPPVLIAPQNDLICADTNVVFKWNFNNVISYRLQVSEDPTFATTFVDKTNISDTSYYLKINKFNKVIYWRVAAATQSCAFAWSEVNHFKLKVPSPNAIFPTDKAKGATSFASTPFDVKFKWNKVADAINYNLVVSKKIDFSTILFEVNTADTTALINLGMAYDTLYYWKLKCTTNVCISYYSDVYRFYTPHPKPVLVSPVNEQTCIQLNNFTFKWNPIQNTTGYRLQVSDTLSFSRVEIDTLVADATSAMLKLKKLNALYYWRLRADDARNNGLWSDTYSFVTTFRAPNLLTPANNKVGSANLINFAWEQFDTNHRYHLQVSATADFATRVLDTNGLKNANFNYFIGDKNKVFYWRIRVSKGECFSDWSSPYSFKTIISSPVLELPANRAQKVSTLAVFDWSDVVDAVTYDIEISKDSAFAVIDRYKREIIGSTMTFAGEPFAEKQKYFWRVRAVNAEGKSDWSAIFSFTTGVMIAEVPKLYYPFNEMIKTPLTVSMLWYDVAKADSFEIHIAKTKDFSIKVAEAVVADTTYQFKTTENYEDFYWRVRSINQGGASNWSNAWSFRSIAALPSGIPKLLLPANDAKETPHYEKLSWEEISNALSYHVQLSKANDFSAANLVEENKYVKTPLFLTQKLENLTTYYWRVKAWNEAGESEWSEVRKFTTLDLVSVYEPASLVFGAVINPNPVSNTTNLSFSISEESNISIKLVSSNGIVLKEVVNQHYGIGVHQLELNLVEYSAGIYYYLIDNGKKNAIGRIVIVR